MFVFGGFEGVVPSKRPDVSGTHVPTHGFVCEMFTQRMYYFARVGSQKVVIFMGSDRITRDFIDRKMRGVSRNLRKRVFRCSEFGKELKLVLLEVENEIISN